MESSTLIIIVIILFIVWKQMTQVNLEEAKTMVKNGAIIIDVRTQGEYSGGHLNRSINIPLGEETAKISKYATEKDTPILVYCLSGSRSAIAVRSLRKSGYTSVHNLGSIRRAGKIEV